VEKCEGLACIVFDRGIPKSVEVLCWWGLSGCRGVIGSFDWCVRVGRGSGGDGGCVRLECWVGSVGKVVQVLLVGWNISLGDGVMCW